MNDDATTAALKELPDGLRDALDRALQASDWVAEQIRSDGPGWRELAASATLGRPVRPAHFSAIESELADAADRDALLRTLRRVKAREALRIAIRDLGGLAELEETLDDLTALADALVRAAHAWLGREHERRFGVARDGEGRRLSLLVVGMGKLGGDELNFSSDIDLVLAYRGSGETDGERPVEAQRFFERLGRDLAQALSEPTADGYVYRTDLRLRPHGESGRIALSFAAMEEYFQREGRDWERYAWVKARPVAGDESDGAALLALMRPFVYRRYLDYAALEALRSLKRQVADEVKRRHLDDDIKLGAGGIREVEFVAQVFQLIRGGRDAALRSRRLLRTLERLAERRLLTATAAEELADAYRFLRALENRLQMARDEQTHRLPSDPAQRERLARAMNEPDWAALSRRLEGHRERVHAHFQSVFEAPAGGEEADRGASALWRGQLDEREALAVLQRLGFTEPGEALERLDGLRGSNRVKALSARGRGRLDRLMPALLEAVAGGGSPDAALPRVLDVLEAIVRRSVYLSLLLENPAVVRRLCALCGESGWVAAQLARAPLLLDELIQAGAPDPDQDWEAVHAELGRATGAVLSDDPEQVLEAIAQFKRARTLQVALAELSGDLDPVQAARQLSALARAVLVRALSLALRSMPRAALAQEELASHYAVVAYGRLGAGELAYDSDLDLVFLYRGDGESELAPFFARLTRRLIHLLTTPTPSGRLYPVDTRLRPNGQAGLLVSPLSAYRHYQVEEAWTWERQALVRARCVYGGSELAAAFESVRAEALGRRREPGRLAGDVAGMRERMRAEHRAGKDDVKHVPGGLVDLEFIVQYETLVHAPAHEALCHHTGTLALLRELARAGLADRAEAGDLAAAYRALLDRLHRITLQAGEGSEPVEPHRRAVRRAWEARFGTEA